MNLSRFTSFLLFYSFTITASLPLCHAHQHPQPQNPPAPAPAPQPPTMTSAYDAAMSDNNTWAKIIKTTYGSDYFLKNSLGQSPQILWIGCSDSRIPETVVTGFAEHDNKTFAPGPGVIFTHRNIANIVQRPPFLEDVSLEAVVDYAVTTFTNSLTAIMVVGHSNCGGCKAALKGSGSLAPLDRWLAQLRDLRVRQQGAIDRLEPDVEAMAFLLAKYNVVEGVQTLAKRESVRSAMIANPKLGVYGVVDDLTTGTLAELVRITKPVSVDVKGMGEEVVEARL